MKLPPPPEEVAAQAAPVEETPEELVGLDPVGPAPACSDAQAEEVVELEAVAPLTGAALHGGKSVPDSTLEVHAAAEAPQRRSALLREKRPMQEAEMDMTPMVDVTFLLLIFFMVTASFTMQKSLNIPKPKNNEAGAGAQSLSDFEQNPEYIVVRVDGFNTYHVIAAAFDDEVECPSDQELMVKLRQARQGDGSGTVPTKMLVIANVNALHKKVVNAIDSGNEIGMEEVQQLTVEDDAEQ